MTPHFTFRQSEWPGMHEAAGKAGSRGRSDIAFDRDENEVELFYRDGRHETLARASKREIAEGLVARVEGFG